jgi:hypothetical protein
VAVGLVSKLYVISCDSFSLQEGRLLNNLKTEKKVKFGTGTLKAGMSFVYFPTK